MNRKIQTSDRHPYYIAGYNSEGVLIDHVEFTGPVHKYTMATWVNKMLAYCSSVEIHESLSQFRSKNK